MSQRTIYLGNTAKYSNTSTVEGSYTHLGNEVFYKIANYDQMKPFFISVVSDSDHWMFISTLGGLTAGRKNADNALFPYYTDDRVRDGSNNTGSRTLLIVKKDAQEYLWEPFSDMYEGVYQTSRNLYKNVSGDKLVFEEINHDLGVSFQYAWRSSEKFGFVKTSKISNTNDSSIQVDILDGIENLLPYGANKDVQNEYSCLLDAYKKNELQTDAGLGLYTMSSILVDRAEPSEALSATTVWSHGLQKCKRLISSEQLDNFRRGEKVEEEVDIRGLRGSYFVNATLELEKQASEEWHIVAEINQGPAKVKNLIQYIQNDKNIGADIEADISKGTDNLMRIVGNADGLQVTEDVLSSNHHFSNVLFNVMRGGLFDDNYSVGKEDLISFAKTINTPTYEKFANFFNDLPDSLHYTALIEQASAIDDANLLRVCREYLPLTFSRRHGDPSRPWNKFAIELKNEDGSKLLSFQGNWRDIFQNWEALCFSIPNFCESMICKFVNASTADGYNPYRITKQGIDWEILDPHDPWSNIGYWGDHQIIYLLKFLEFSQDYHPGMLQDFLSKEIFCYANVPYNIKPYENLLQDPHNTIDYDSAKQTVIDQRVKQMGADGKLILNASGEVLHVNLTEKLLTAVLSKLTNFIPEGGIWMNTQRPEWNDANNALVGYGVSMVTLYYTRRFQNYLLNLFKEISTDKFSISKEVVDLFSAINQAFLDNKHLLADKISDQNRKLILDQLGQAGSVFRSQVYQNDFSGDRVDVTTQDLINFCELSLEFIDHTIRANKREDGLYHAYNLMTAKPDAIEINYLYEMLEGQVSVLCSGYLSPKEAIDVLSALRQSDIYTARQHSYLLYPDRQLKRFVDKNKINIADAEKSTLISTLIADGNTELVEKDVNGQIYFNGKFNNVVDAKATLEKLKQKGYSALVDKDAGFIAEIFEKIFDHKSFTGRSGGMYGYEGLGCIYWHMVSKLLLAAQENYKKAVDLGESDGVLDQLAALYYDIRAGIGFNKTPENYGAFPTDPYSHTPGFAGAKQPGMTGQVKEEVITRLMELGVIVERGEIQFNPILLRASEFLSAPNTLKYFTVEGQESKIALNKGQLGFTYCQVPIVYSLGETTQIQLHKADNSIEQIDGNTINAETSMSIFDKRGDISKIEVTVNPKLKS
ncbi:hypothetical protein TDB9533_00359 [Thalassocella blandensis]|nr:hypothetical protein TDB9533_00359 [Thalassocella blandensis]